MPKRLKKISEETIQVNPWWVYKHDVFEKPNGQLGDYYYAETGGGVKVIPILPDGRIVMILQHRYLEDKQSIEFPSGGIEKGMDAGETARAELLEETGYLADEIIKIGTFQPDNGLIKNLIHVFIAQVSGEPKSQVLNDTEEIDVMYRRPDEIDDMIKRNDIWDGITIAAWTMSRYNLKNNSYGEQN